jgi:RNA polymerase sigma factor (TIGR02999 family)
MGGGDVTQLLQSWRSGDRKVLDLLVPLLYSELRRIASYHLSRERTDHTLSATGLVHEAYLKLVRQDGVEWQNRAHFFAIASQVIRRILVDHARSRKRAKRGSGLEPVQLDEALGVPERTDWEVLALNDALDRLFELDERQGRIVEMRFFAGLSVEEVAEVLGVSPATVKREWATARLWLLREIRSVAGN